MITLRGSKEREDTKRAEEELRRHSFRYEFEPAPPEEPPALTGIQKRLAKRR